MSDEPDHLGLTLQSLSSWQASLVVAAIARWRSPDGWFLPAELTSLFVALRVPPPGNPHATLGSLKERNFVLEQPGSTPKRYSVTPTGQQKAAELAGGTDLTLVSTDLGPQYAVFAHERHPTLPPELCPPAWSPGVRTFLDKYPFESNVFLMLRFPKGDLDDPMSDAVATLRATVEGHGLTLHVASDQQIVDDLWGNVGAHMWACRYGIGILETYADETLNDNMLIELGSMLMLGRRCMILRDEAAPMPPTDLTSQIFKTVDLADLAAVAEETENWIVRDLREA